MRTSKEVRGLAPPIAALAAVGVGAVVAAWRFGPAGAFIGGGAVVVAATVVAVAVRRAVARPLAELADEHRNALAQLATADVQAAQRESALAHTEDAVLLVRLGGHVDYANPTARTFLLEGEVRDVSHRLKHADLKRLVGRAAGTGEMVVEDVTLWLPNARPVRARAVPLADGTTLLLLSDLSESYRVDRVRRDFVANVSHELKTPVAAMRALADTAGTAMRSDDHANAQHFIERLGVEAKRLGDLVSDLLDLSRVEAGADLAITKVHLDELLTEAADRGRVIADTKKIEIVVHDTDIAIHGDASQLAMAVKNLVNNAVRYSERGRVELAARREEGAVTITVADEGIGIPSDDLGRIFERFYRVDKARSRGTGGTGLGLAIVRHVIENHGGRVDVASELGRGTTFTLTLPSPVEAGTP
jgi:two-component system sensor histidine kinase SenX3